MRKKLIFMATADPSSAPENVWRAFHFADVAHRAGLDTEVRLVSDAVKSCRPACVLPTERGKRLAEKLEARERPYPVSVCETSCDLLDVNDDDIRAIGGVKQADEKLLADVADGAAELVHVG